MEEVRTIATAIISAISQLDLKPTPHNLNQLIAVHNHVAQVIEITSKAVGIKATEISKQEKKVDKK